MMAVTVDVMRAGAGGLMLVYRATDPQGSLVIPAPAAGERKDNLWKQTCFEVFICIPGGEAYFELNFSPSSEWAAYWFDSYRAGMTMADGIEAPRIKWIKTHAGFELHAQADLSGLAGLPTATPWRLGLTGVIEDAPGQLSYWALTHPPGVPDFHNAAGWVAEV